jgi:hypothetical protein
MAFEFLGKALRGATDILGGLADEVGKGRTNREEDVRKVRRAFAALGRMEEPEDEPSRFIDRPPDTAIRGFQRDKGLRVDGFMRPGGSTQRSLQDDVLGSLKQENDVFGRDPNNGFDRFRPRSLSSRNSLPGDRGPFLSRFDLGPDRSDPDGSFRLLDLGERARSARRTMDFRPGWDDIEADQRLVREDRDWPSSTHESSPARNRLAPRGRVHAERTATDAPPAQTEPPRLKPFLDKAERNLRRTVQGWREQGMTDAARHLEHFLDGSGEPITYNRDQARSFSPVRDAEETAQGLIRERITERARGLRDGQSKEITETVTGEHGSLGHGLDLLRGLFGDTDRFNDNLATGRTTVRSTFNGTISRNGDEISVGGTVDHDWSDGYNFHPSRFGLPQPGAAGGRSLEQYRGARTYTFGGKWRQRLSGDVGPRGSKLNFVDLD